MLRLEESGDFSFSGSRRIKQEQRLKNEPIMR
jgi:hypothetical protein